MRRPPLGEQGHVTAHEPEQRNVMMPAYIFGTPKVNCE
jgi:hypothetical protein